MPVEGSPLLDLLARTDGWRVTRDDDRGAARRARAATTRLVSSSTIGAGRGARSSPRATGGRPPSCRCGPPAGPFHIGLLMGNQPEYLFALFGAARVGAVVVGINDTRRGEELARDIRHADCAAVLCDASRAPLLAGLDLGGAIRVRRVGAEWRDGLAAATDAGDAAGGGRRRPLGPDLHVGIDGRAEGGAHDAGPRRARGDQLDVVDERRHLVLRDAALPRQRAERDRAARAVVGRDDRAAGAVLGVAVHARRPPLRRDVLQHGRPRARVHPRDAARRRRIAITA